LQCRWPVGRRERRCGRWTSTAGPARCATPMPRRTVSPTCASSRLRTAHPHRQIGPARVVVDMAAATEPRWLRSAGRAEAPRRRLAATLARRTGLAHRTAGLIQRLPGLAQPKCVASMTTVCIEHTHFPTCPGSVGRQGAHSDGTGDLCNRTGGPCSYAGNDRNGDQHAAGDPPRERRADVEGSVRRCRADCCRNGQVASGTANTPPARYRVTTVKNLSEAGRPRCANAHPLDVVWPPTLRPVRPKSALAAARLHPPMKPPIRLQLRTHRRCRQ
jgi:hypothetical protein